MSTGHTPGPWTTQVPSIPITRLAVEDRMVLARAFDGSKKAVVDRVRGGSPEQANANALLIAAAPDLLQALREVTGDCYALDGVALGPRCVFCLMREGEPHDDDCTMHFVLAAIAKAEGRA